MHIYINIVYAKYIGYVRYWSSAFSTSAHIPRVCTSLKRCLIACVHSLATCILQHRMTSYHATRPCTDVA